MRAKGSLETGLLHLHNALPVHNRGAIGAINLNFITPLWTFQNSKYELTTDLKAV